MDAPFPAAPGFPDFVLRSLHVPTPEGDNP